MKTGSGNNLYSLYPPSPPCACKICKSYCQRPGWWTVDEAQKAIQAGYGHRMMLEMSPDLSFGVLSPAFKGSEQNFALQEHAGNGCNFLKEGLCELHSTGLQPLECRFCHHTRRNLGQNCHSDIEKDWNSLKGRLLVERWGQVSGLWQKYNDAVRYPPLR